MENNKRTLANSKPLLLIGLCLCLFRPAQAQKHPLKPAIGIAAGLENDSLLAAAGYSCIIESIAKRIAPKALSAEAFEQSLPLYKSRKTAVWAFNLFIPADMKLVGPAVDEKAVLEYVDTVMARVRQTNTRMIVWGSGGARRIPDGFDRKIAEDQFITIARKIAAIARKHGIVLALENLNSSETNFITTLAEALRIVQKIDHPNLRLNADIYHMLKESESPAVIRKTRKYLVHVELAEKENRTAPGVTGTDFRPFLRELKKIGYHQKIVIEGRWDKVADIAASAFQYLQHQVDEVYGADSRH